MTFLFESKSIRIFSNILYFIPWQETVTAVVWLLLGGGGMHLALKRFNRKDVEV